MRKLVLICSVLFFLFSCSDSDERRVNKIINAYIHEAKLDNEAYVTVEEIDFDSLYAYRISATYHFFVEYPPYEIETMGDHYIFKFRKGAPPLELKDAPEIVQFREEYREWVVIYHPGDWLVLICKNTDNQEIFKDPPPVERVDSSGEKYWCFAPLDSVRQVTDIIEPEEIENFECGSK